MADGCIAVSERSIALERAYVHEVYERINESERDHTTCPRVLSFLKDLEPGSLVCDVGCGGGKYINVNPSVFTVGGDRCFRLTMQARNNDNQVLVCDNLSLPFRDNCFDAVISIAVIHHFATAERRALAVRELARVLRIGGRVLLTVWAMEHEGRTFQSQDVLIPWHRPQSLSSSVTRVGDTSTLTTTKSEGLTRAKYSPATSSLSSPNETCYSFVRKALQKLAIGKRPAHTWLPHAWLVAAREARNESKESHEYDKDARDLPIELRRIDDDDFILERLKPPDPLTNKSRSLTDINDAEIHCLVRSQSSSTNLQAGNVRNNSQTQMSACDTEPPRPREKPKLVKQKRSVNEEDADDVFDHHKDLQNQINNIPELDNIDNNKLTKRQGVQKQTSLNEEFMSAERLKERDHLRRNIRKQTSLNEEYLYSGHGTLNSIKDSFMSTSATTAKRLQSLKNGLANKFKTTANVERATVIGFMKMLQGWTSQDIPGGAGEHAPHSPAEVKDSDDRRERRHSKEDGSDSSKDSSLQSDTSVDSEDSFASVIFIPKADGNSNIDPMSPTPTSPGPTSPRLKTSPGIQSPRIKPVFPIIRPPLSPKSPSNVSKVLMAQYTYPATNGGPQHFFGPLDSPRVDKFETSIRKNITDFFPEYFDKKSTITSISEDDEDSPTKLLAEITKDMAEIHKLTADTENYKPKVVLQDVKPYPKITLQTVAELPENINVDENTRFLDRKPQSVTDAKRKERLRQIKEMLKQGIPGNSKTTFPIVRRQVGKVEPVVKTHPKLVSLELFNPETDDMDSDSSDVSSPDSVDSVISVVPDELKKTPVDKDTNSSSSSPRIEQTEKSSETSSSIMAEAATGQTLDETMSTARHTTSGSSSGSSWSLNRLSPGDLRLLEERYTSSSGSSSSLERISPGHRSKDRSPRRCSTTDSTWSLNRLSPNRLDAKSLEDDPFRRKSPTRLLYESHSTSSTDSDRSVSKSESIGRLTNEPLVTCKSDIIGPDDDWKDVKDEHLSEFAEKLSERLMKEIDQYSKSLSEENFDSPEDLEAAEERKKRREETKQVLDELSDRLKQLDNMNRQKVEVTVEDQGEAEEAGKLFTACGNIRRNKSPTRRRIIAELAARRPTIEKQENIINNNAEIKYDRNKETEKTEEENGNPELSIESKRSIESETSIDSLKSSLKVGRSTDSSELEKMEISPESMTSRSSASTAPLKSGISVESTETGELTAPTGSLASLGSMASYGEYKTRLIRPLEPALSDASQESGGSEGGAVTNHKYYHVFKRGELEQLIEKYVENLHIITSYYDHASWCIVAEKVQVWTI